MATSGDASERIREHLAAHQDDLVDQFERALRETLFTSRAYVRPADLKRIAMAEAEGWFDYLRQPDRAAATARGTSLCQTGLGEEAVLRMGQALRLFCHTHLDGDLFGLSLEVIEAYHNALMQGFIEERDAVTLEEQERIRAAVQRTVSQYTLQMKVAADVARAATSILDLNELLSTSVDLIRERFDFYYVGLFLVDEYGEWAVLRAGTGEPGQEMLRRGHKLKVGGQSMIGWCVAHGQPRIALDVGREAVHFDNPLLPETRSEIALPLVLHGQVIGAMTVQSRLVGAFSQQDVAVLQVIADQLASAVENARLFAQAQVHLEELRAIQRGYTRRAWAEEALAGLTGYRYELNTDTFAPADDLWQPEVEGAVHEGGPGVSSADASPPLAVPITVRGQVIGTIDLYDVTAPRQWSDDEIALTTAVVSQAALAIENARLFEETQRRATQLAAAAEVARDATAILDVDQLLDQTVHLISEQFGFYHAGVFLLDEQSEYAVLRAASSEGGRRMLERGHQLRVGEVGIVGYAAGTGEPRIAFDVGEDAAHFAHADLPDTRSEMALPLKVQERVIGVLDVQSTQEAAFSEEDVAVLQTMADQLATAIANARLFEEAQRRARRERLIREITAHIRGAVDIESILQTTVQEVGKALGASHGIVRLGTEAELATPRVEGQAKAQMTQRKN
jgi:GAF domain-containing protein